MTTRALVLTAILVSFWAWLEAAARPTHPPSREPLANVPLSIGDWHGHDAPPLEARVLDILGADDYIVRWYRSGNTPAILSLYIGYHTSQRHDASIHSPMSCLPGAGWIPVHADRIEIPDPRTEHLTATVNRVVVQKGEERQLVLYWYQSQGRVVASEYVSKAYLFVDALRSGRTDAALVRITAPFPVSDEQAAQSASRHFASAVLPVLGAYLPN